MIRPFLAVCSDYFWPLWRRPMTWMAFSSDLGVSRYGTVRLKPSLGRDQHVTRKLNTWQWSVMKKDSKNVYGNPRLQRPSLTLKTFPQSCSFSVKLGRCSLGVPYTFLESPGYIQDYCEFGATLKIQLLAYKTFLRTAVISSWRAYTFARGYSHYLTMG